MLVVDLLASIMFVELMNSILSEIEYKPISSFTSS